MGEGRGGGGTELSNPSPPLPPLARCVELFSTPLHFASHPHRSCSLSPPFYHPFASSRCTDISPAPASETTLVIVETVTAVTRLHQVELCRRLLCMERKSEEKEEECKRTLQKATLY